MSDCSVQCVNRSRALKWLYDRVGCTDEDQVAWNSWHHLTFVIIRVMLPVCNSMFGCVFYTCFLVLCIIHGQDCFVCMHVYICVPVVWCLIHNIWHHHHRVHIAWVQVQYLCQWVDEKAISTSCNRWNHLICIWSFCVSSWGNSLPPNLSAIANLPVHATWSSYVLQCTCGAYL